MTVTDPEVRGLTCTPANGSALGPGASMSCTATHTVTQADIDAGHYANTACVDDGAGGAAQAVRDEDVPAVRRRHLSITKVATEASYDAVGEVIHYTIVATNTGNTTLAAVTVGRSRRRWGGCTPAERVGGWLRALDDCTATHTVTQADIDAGHYANTACVDDGAGGAAQQCATEDVPAVQAPALSITKVATEANFNAVGQVIALHDRRDEHGQHDLGGGDGDRSGRGGAGCTPANGSALAPGASISCTATHTVTQADLDAGHFANTACVETCAGATEVCDVEDVPAVQAPASGDHEGRRRSRASTRSGQMIHYTIVATNTGNTTLAAVTVTDPNVTGLTCTPANGSASAPGASMTCTATHTVTQADIDAGRYANTACVDDGAGGAAQECAARTCRRCRRRSCRSRRWRPRPASTRSGR